jgi:hypothetical protein
MVLKEAIGKITQYFADPREELGAAHYLVHSEQVPAGSFSFPV